MKRNALVSFLTVGSLLTVLAGTANAATFVVNNVNDTGPGSLRDALNLADAANGDDVVNFDPSVFKTAQTIQTNSSLAINPAAGNDALTIEGRGANLLTVRGPVAGGPVLNAFDGNNTINGITFQGTTTPEFAAAVNTDSDLILNGVVITGNTSDAAGNGSGGGLIVFDGNTTILRSTISGNTVNNSGANGSGGGIVKSGPGTLTLLNSTVSGNSVRGGGADGGGGIFNVGGTVRLVNATIANNTVEHGAGGVFQGSVQLANSLIAVNTGDAGNDVVGTDFTSQGHNLIGTGTGGTVTLATGDQVGTNASIINPLLGPLGSNGGTTPTIPLLDGSPAIDAADPNNSDAAFPAPPALIPSLTTDQRGVARPQDGGNDIGAFELVPNRVDVGKVKRNTNNGTAKLEVEVFAAGELALKGNGIKSVRPSAGRRAHAKPVPAAGTYKLKVKAKGGKKKKLKKKGKVKVKAKITFSPTNGIPNTETKKVTLKLKR